MKQIPSYIKDTNHFINKVNNFSVPINSISVTMDVRLLNTSIPNNQGIATTKKRFDSYIHKFILTKIIKTFLALILTLNNLLCDLYFLYKLSLKIFLQENTLFQKLSDRQNFLNAKSEHSYSLKKYSLQPSTSNSTNMLHIPIILQSLYQTY